MQFLNVPVPLLSLLPRLIHSTYPIHNLHSTSPPQMLTSPTHRTMLYHPRQYHCKPPPNAPTHTLGRSSIPDPILCPRTVLLSIAHSCLQESKRIQHWDKKLAFLQNMDWISNKCQQFLHCFILVCYSVESVKLVLIQTLKIICSPLL